MRPCESRVAEVLPLPEAVAALVHDGDAVALEGFTHLIPFAAGHEVLRQGRTRARADPDDAGRAVRPDGRGRARRASSCSPTRATRASARCTGCATRSSTAGRGRWRSRSTRHAGMANRYAAGASGLPCALMRGYVGTRPRGAHARRAGDVPVHAASSSWRCPRSTRTWRSCTRRRPTGPATCSCGGSRACRRRRCSRRAARSSRWSGSWTSWSRAGRRGAAGLDDRRGGGGAGRLAAVLRARAHAPRQRLLPRVGRASAATASGSRRGWRSTCCGRVAA